MLSRSIFVGLTVLLAVTCKAFSFQIASKIVTSPPSSSCNPYNTRNVFLEVQKLQNYQRRKLSHLKMSEDASTKKKSDLPMLLDPGTKGGALFLSLVLFIIPIIVYEVATLGLGYDGIETGKWIGVGFTVLTTVLWVGTYIFRVATKDMTYVSESERWSFGISWFHIYHYLITKTLQFIIKSFS